MIFLLWHYKCENAGRSFLLAYPIKKMRRSLTWKEFNEQTNKVANYLKNKLGVQKR